MSTEATYVNDDVRTSRTVNLAFTAQPLVWLSVTDIVERDEAVHRFDVRLMLVEMLVAGEVAVNRGDDGRLRYRRKSAEERASMPGRIQL